jgi:thiol-disulfide isomerase/thioredoxin
VNGRFFLLTTIILFLVGVGVPVQATEPLKDSPFFKSFFQVERFDPPRATDAWVFVGEDGTAPPVQLSSMRGRWGIVNIWATWCAPCIYELPKLNALAARLTSPNGPYIWAVSVDRDVSRDRLGTYVTRFNLTHMPILQDAAATIRVDFNVDQLPVTFIVDPDGAVRAALYGAAEWDSDAAYKFVETFGKKSF